MKKSLTVLVMMLIMSIGNVTLAQTWAEYDLPASATAVAVSDHYIFVFTTDQYYEVGFPLTPSGSTLPWAQMLIPGTGKIKGGACTPNGIVFALRENGDLWRLINGQWENIFQNIDGLTGLKGNRFFAWSDDFIYEYINGFTQMPFDGTKAIGFNDDNVFVFTENNGNYSGPNSWSLGPAEDLPNFYPMDAAMTDNEYVVVGSAIGNAAWHQSPPDACVPFTHVLTGGVINSVAALKDTAYVGGQLGNKGMLFNTSDMSGIYIVPEPVLQVRSNNVGVVVAVSASKLYVYGNTATVGNKQPITVTPTKLIIAPNPVQDGCLRVIAPEAAEVYLSDLSGRLIAGTRLDKGVNEINVAFLPSGIYLLDGQKVIIP